VKEMGYLYENMEHICGNNIIMGENMAKTYINFIS
jgi:hypothetical protein